MKSIFEIIMGKKLDVDLMDLRHIVQKNHRSLWYSVSEGFRWV